MSMGETEIVELARKTPPENLASLVGALATADAIARSRMLTPASAPVKAVGPDEWIRLDDARTKYGMSSSWFYHQPRMELRRRREGKRLLLHVGDVERLLDR
jgi:hypothetical protein